MSLAISSTLEYLKMRLNIPESRMLEYRDKTVKDILDAEAALGNQAAIQLAADMFTNPTQLIELFQLADPNNKLIILQNMTSAQLQKLVPMLETEDLVQGLRYFSMEALMNMLQKVPKEELLKVVFQMFSERQIIELMPEKELDRVLTGMDMDKELLLKNLKAIPETFLAQMLESVTGQKAEGNQAELISQIGHLGDLDYKNALKNLDLVHKQDLTLLLCSTDNKYFLNFNTDAYTHIISREREKDETVKAMGVIKPEYLHKMMDRLPQDLLSVVITQIDTEKFAQALITKFPELLAKFISG